MLQKNITIGLYDSGIGGKTIQTEIEKLLPDLRILYFADQKSLPLGNKTVEEIQKYVINGVENLYNQGAELVILACNTATVNTIRYLQQIWLPKNFKNKYLLGISQPFIELMNQEYIFLKKQKGLLMVTPATFKSGFYQAELKKIGFTDIQTVAFENLARIIEKSINFNPETTNKIKLNSKTANVFELNKYLSKTESTQEIINEFNFALENDSVNKKDIEFVLFGCTHYPFVYLTIKDLLPNCKYFINPAENVALKLKLWLERHKLY